MNEDQKKHQFDAALPLPGDGQPTSSLPKQPDDTNPAADLIRKKIEAAYANEPNTLEEAAEVEQLSPTTQFSKHQQFVNSLTNSSKSLAEIQIAWHEYYQGLPDKEKHEVWQEFYTMHTATSQYAAARPQTIPTQSEPTSREIEARSVAPTIPKALKPVSQTLAEAKKQILASAIGIKRRRSPEYVQSLLFGLAAGAGAVLIVMFSFFNERFIAPFIQPSRNVTNTPLISDSATIGPEPKIIIPKINVDIPVVYGVSSIQEEDVQKALEGGVLHYADTALPGQNGNMVIVGHSSNNIFNKGKYKFAFVLLNRLELGDTFYLQKDGQRYTYQVYKREIIEPTNVSVLGPRDKPATVSLITCDPPGTSTNRLVVVGEQISPDLASNAPTTTENVVATQTQLVPGNAQSLWSRIWDWLAR
ncbi:class D sortase [Candidatus Saccharibacteria bacterium]|nr:class D sortase [Candidatus Saccharibacteria bacterium]